MVYFKLEFGFHLPGRKHRAENKTNSKAQPAWDFISKEVESAEARKCYKTAANYRTAANSLTLFWQRDDWTMADICRKNGTLSAMAHRPGIVHEHHIVLHAFLAHLI